MNKFDAQNCYAADTNAPFDQRGQHVEDQNNTVNIYQHVPRRPVDEASLAAAQRKLAAMPLENLPPHAILPPGSKMPFARNPLFVGRDHDLRKLATELKGGTSVAIGQIAAATGWGGIGKTQLATEFVHRYGQFFAGGVFWLSFADPQGIPGVIAACGGAGGMDLRPDFATLPFDERVGLVLSAWSNPLPRLLVFDNCEDEELLSRWRPPSGGARVLITSRRGSWNPTLGVSALRLDVLSRPESVALLRKHLPDLSEADGDAIAQELGDLPLALHLAGSFLALYRHAAFGAPRAYLEELRRDNVAHSSLTEDGATLPTDHTRHVGRTFEVSYAQLDPQVPVDAVAQDLLARSACLAPGEPIPRALLLATLALPEDDITAARRAEDALRRLDNLGLLTSLPEGDLLLHRLLASFVRLHAPDDDVQTTVEETLLAATRRLNNVGYPAVLLGWPPHLRAVIAVALEQGPDVRMAALCNELGYHLQARGDYKGTKPYFERALAIREDVLGPKHPDTARSLNNLGYLLQAQGDYPAAKPHYKRALVIFEEILGPKHPDTASSLSNLAGLLQTQGDYAGAKPYYERALVIFEEILGPKHPDTARSLNNLGYLLQAQGDYEAAKPCYKRALSICEEVLGPKHPDTAASLNNLGYLSDDQGDYEAAKLYYKRALAICEEVLGLKHPFTERCLTNLAGLLSSQGNYEEAKPYFEQALAICEEVLGPKHPDTATCLNNLGEHLLTQGDYAGAMLYCERALSIREDILGPHHPDTAINLNNLAVLLQAQGDYAEAISYYKRALAIFEDVLGSTHPSTASGLNNLGMLLLVQGDYEGAKPYLEQALAIREDVLGPMHPDTAISINKLAELLWVQGDEEGAKQYYTRALAIREKVLGPKHPDTALSLYNLAELLRAQGDEEGAKPYYTRALAIKEEVLGPKHPDTANCLNGLAAICYHEARFADAARLMDRALAIWKAVLGVEHPKTKDAQSKLVAIEEQLADNT